MQASNTREREDFISSVENLKKRISSMEQENADMQVEIDAGKEASRAVETEKLDGRSKLAEMEAEIQQLKERNRKLVIMSAPSAPEMSLQQAIETLQREKDSLAVEKHKLSKLNQNQKKVTQWLEGTAPSPKDKEGRRRAEREDNLERGAALLANLYFTQKNMEELAKRSST